jgi:DNA-binding phage protein
VRFRFGLCPIPFRSSFFLLSEDFFSSLLARDFRETVVARAKCDPAFKTALLQEALQAFLEGEVAPGLILLRDCINATVGFGALSAETHIPEKSLMRMVGPRGNPTASNLFAMVAALQHQIHTQAQVATRPAQSA